MLLSEYGMGFHFKSLLLSEDDPSSFHMISTLFTRTPKTRLFLFTFFIISCSGAVAQNISSLALNSTFSGSTAGEPRDIFTKFNSVDIRGPPIGRGGQVLLELTVNSNLSKTSLDISTCKDSDFDTYLALLDGDPSGPNTFNVIAESGNDINCAIGKKKAFLSTQVVPGQYFLLVTGNNETEGNFTVAVTATSAETSQIPWGLDRLDQRVLPLNNKYDVKPTGDRAWIYLIDSGVRTSHEEFEGRAEDGYDFVNDKKAFTPDCTGHGTHIAGILAGKTFGVAKRSRVASVRAFDCDNSARISAIVDSLGWALLDIRNKDRKNAIIAMMFSTATVDSALLNSTISAVERSQIPVIVPAGNNGEDACKYYPGSVKKFLAVGSIASDDSHSEFSNYGNCTKIYAPGDEIRSSWHTSNSSSRTMSGTAQAAAHVAGVVANLMHLNPNIDADLVNNIIQSVSTLDVVKDVPSTGPTRLLFVRSVPEYLETPPPQREVYLFIILRFEDLTCKDGSEELEAIQKTFIEELDFNAARLLASCWKEFLSEGESDPQLVRVRIQVAERTAVADFRRLEELLNTRKSALEDMFGLLFKIVEQPWAVDSTGVVFWGAPTFSDTESNSLSRGAVAGIVGGVFLIVSVAIVIAWLCYRRWYNFDVVESLHGSTDFEKGPVKFEDFGGINSTPTSLVLRSFRNVMRSVGLRRSGSIRDSSGSDMDSATGTGMHGMGSVTGKWDDKEVSKDTAHMESYGAEAFVGLTSLSGGMHGKRGASLGEDAGHGAREAGRASFRGANNLVLAPLAAQPKGDPGAGDDAAAASEVAGMGTGDELCMRSVGAEAFAMFGIGMEADEIDAAVGQGGEGIRRTARTETRETTRTQAVGNEDEEGQVTEVDIEYNVGEEYQAEALVEEDDDAMSQDASAVNGNRVQGESGEGSDRKLSFFGGAV